MKILRKILFIVLGVILAVFIILHILVNVFGKTLLTQKLEDTFNRKIRIGRLTTSFPLDIHVKNLEAEGLFKIDEIVAGRGVIDVFRRSFRLSLLRVIHPRVTIERNFISAVVESTIPSKDLKGIIDKTSKSRDNISQPNVNPLAVSRGRFLSPRFSIDLFIISDGALNFTDKSMDNKEIVIKVEHINTKIDNLNLSRIGSKVTSFELRGEILWREGQEKGKIELEGWLNLVKRNAEASLKILDIDAISLYPYYSQWVDLEKARIEKAKLNFTSNIHSLNNDVTAECRLELTNIVRKPRAADEPQEKAEKITDVVLDIFKSLNQGNIVLDFTIKTKMDNPQFGFGTIRAAFEDKLVRSRAGGGIKAQDILSLPAKLIEGTIKGATDISKAVIDGTFAVGNEIRKSVEDSFRKEPAPDKTTEPEQVAQDAIKN